MKSKEDYSKKIEHLLKKVKSRRYKQLINKTLRDLSKGVLTLTASQYFQFWADIHDQNNVIFFRVISSISPENWKEAEMQVYSQGQIRNIEVYKKKGKEKKKEYWELIKESFPEYDFEDINFERIFLVEEKQLEDEKYVKTLSEVIASQNWNIPTRILCTDIISKSEYEDFGIVLLNNGDRFLMNVNVMEDRAVGGGEVIFNDEEIKKYLAIYMNMRNFSVAIPSDYTSDQIEKKLTKLEPQVSMKNLCVECYNETEKTLKSGEWKKLPPSPKKMWYEIWDAEDKAILDFVSKLKPKKVVEPGCGSGRIIQLLLDSKIPFEKIVGIEQNEGIYGSTLRRFRKKDNVHIIHYLISGKESIPYEEGTFDLCINSSNLVGWQGDEDEWIKEMLRVSKVLFFTAYKKGYEKERVEMYKTRPGHEEVKISKNKNVMLDNVDAFDKQSKLSKSYTEKELRELCEENSEKYELFEISKYMYGCILYK